MNQTSFASSSLRVAVVCAGWHADIVHRARDSLRDELARHGVPPAGITDVAVPGAFELPLHAQALARSGRFDAIVCCAFVVDGGIYRHDFVSSAVIDGLMRVQLDTGVPVLSAVLTPKEFREHLPEHEDFFGAHFVKKGVEAARACLATVASLRAIGGAAAGARDGAAAGASQPIAA